MATAVAHPAPPSEAPHDTAFFGHPRGLSTLFFTEMWERFSYYGMRALLILFMTAPLATGGLGFNTAKAGAVYGTYVALAYLTSLPGGWIADRFLGQRRSTLYGGVVIMLGHISLAIPGMVTFYLGLLLVVTGTGLLKPNVSTMVGALYGQDDVATRRRVLDLLHGDQPGSVHGPAALRLAGPERAVPRDPRFVRDLPGELVALGLRHGGDRHVLRHHAVSGGVEVPG